MNFVNTVIAENGPAPAAQTPFEQEMAGLIVESLQLEAQAGDILPAAALFHEGLGLDSIDALEIALAISRRYGLDLKSDDARRGEIFASLRNLAAHVEANRIR